MSEDIAIRKNPSIKLDFVIAIDAKTMSTNISESMFPRSKSNIIGGLQKRKIDQIWNRLEGLFVKIKSTKK